MPMGPGYFLLFRRAAVPTPEPPTPPVTPPPASGGSGFVNEFTRYRIDDILESRRQHRKLETEVAVSLLLLLKARR